MSALGEVVAGLRAALAASARTRQLLRRVETALDVASESFARSLEGSASQESAQISAFLALARDRVETARRALSRAERHVQDYLDNIGAAGLPPPDLRGPAGPAARVEQLRRELPPPVVRGSGSKTHGRWTDPGGVARPMVSGRDELAHRVNEVLDEMGCPTLPVVASTDVELKLAVLMRDKGREEPEMRNITVVINHRPCRGRLGCEGLVPVVLPEGYSLTVHGPNYRKRFTGGAQPWWR